MASSSLPVSESTIGIKIYPILSDGNISSIMSSIRKVTRWIIQPHSHFWKFIHIPCFENYLLPLKLEESNFRLWTLEISGKNCEQKFWIPSENSFLNSCYMLLAWNCSNLTCGGGMEIWKFIKSLAIHFDLFVSTHEHEPLKNIKRISSQFS